MNFIYVRTYFNRFFQNFCKLLGQLSEVLVTTPVGISGYGIVNSKAHQIRLKSDGFVFRDVPLSFLQFFRITRANYLKRSLTITLIFAEMVFEMDTMSFAISISFRKSWNAIEILWSVAFCLCWRFLSIPMIPVRVFISGNRFRLLALLWGCGYIFLTKWVILIYFA